MRQRLTTFFSNIPGYITRAATAIFGVIIATPVVLWDLAKKAVKAVQDFISNRWRLLALTTGLAGLVYGLYHYYGYAYEEGRRVGQCETGCWVMQGEYDYVSESGACVCVGDSFVFQKPDRLKN